MWKLILANCPHKHTARGGYYITDAIWVAEIECLDCGMEWDSTAGPYDPQAWRDYVMESKIRVYPRSWPGLLLLGLRVM